MTKNDLDASVKVSTLANGIRVLAIPMDHALSATVGVFVRTGSRDETAESNGISHFLEHMAFKGTKTRSAQAVNLDAEMLGADLNAYTSRDMTAYHMSGLGRHSGQMLAMLADIVCESVFPNEEIEREREVVLQEAAECGEDPSDRVGVVLDALAYPGHPMGMPVIGELRNIERFAREDLLAYVAERYVGANIVVAGAGKIDAEAFALQAESLFGKVPAGAPKKGSAPVHCSGVAVEKAPISQVFAAIAFPAPSNKQNHWPAALAAEVFGGGMSSPLMDQVRERMGLAYQVGSGADIRGDCGQFVIEATTAPKNVDAFLDKAFELLARHAEAVDPVQVERAKNQVSVRIVSAKEHAWAYMEQCVEQLFEYGEIRSVEYMLAKVEAITPEEVRAAFEAMLAHKPAIALVGAVSAKSKAKALKFAR